MMVRNLIKQINARTEMHVVKPQYSAPLDAQVRDPDLIKNNPIRSTMLLLSCGVINPPI